MKIGQNYLKKKTFLHFLGARTLFAGSKCHDLVVADAAGTIISGHYDKKLRFWDAYADKCRLELQYNASITSLSYFAGLIKIKIIFSCSSL